MKKAFNKSWSFISEKWQRFIQNERSAPLRFGVAVIVALTLSLFDAMIPYTPNRGLFMAGLTICLLIFVSLYGGLWPAILMGSISIFSIDFFYVEPVRKLPATGGDFLFLGVYTTMLFLMVLLTATLKSAYRRSVKSEEESRSTRALLHSIIEGTPDAITAKDTNHRFTLVNSATAKIIGRPAPQVLGTSVADVFPPSNAKTYMDEDDHVMTTKMTATFENQVTTENGETITLLTTKGPLIDGRGRVTGVFSIARNITRLKNTEKELRSAVAARDEFLSVASHELKTPVTALYLQLQLLDRFVKDRAGEAGDQVTRLTRQSVESCQQINTLLSQLLDITRIRVGKLTLEKRRMDLKEAVEKNMSRMSEEISHSGSAVNFSAPESVIGTWDSNRVNQIIGNLLSNALKFGEGKPIDVAVLHDKSRDFARLEVRDRGIGIPDELQQKIFERFERAVSGEKISGLGLGLYIVRQLIEAHGGSITVESKPGQGALFTVQLPLNQRKFSVAEIPDGKRQMQDTYR